MWSVGILMYQLLTGRFPFWEDIRNLSLQQACHSTLAPLGVCCQAFPSVTYVTLTAGVGK